MGSSVDEIGEKSRVEAVHSLDGGCEPSGGPLAQVVDALAHLFAAPMAFVSLVDDVRQSFVAKSGSDLCETPKAQSFCAHAVADRGLLVVEDATRDPRFIDNPLVTGPPGVRFYAGAPLITREGHAVGALCVLDVRTRPGLDARERRLLIGLAELAVAHMERQRLSTANETLMRLAAVTPDALITTDAMGAITFWNKAAKTVFGYSRAEALGASMALIVPEDRRAGHLAEMRRLAAADDGQLQGAVELEARRSDGTLFPVEMSLAHWCDGDGPQFAAVIRDVSERRREQEALHELTNVDALTGLPNRVAFLRAVDARTRTDTPFSLIMVALDRFKPVNESSGLGVGDLVLREAGARIALAAGDQALTARLGADEFGVLLKGSDDPLQATALCERLTAALRGVFNVEAREFRLGASIGLVLSPGLARPGDAHEALHQALLALQESKREGGGVTTLFNPRMGRQADERKRLDEALQRAVRSGHLELHYQPQVRLSDGKLVGAEALLRWRDPEQGLIWPAAFLPQLEKSDLSLQVGRWILDQACRFGAELHARGVPLRIGVNLFAAHVRSSGLERDVKASLAMSGLPPQLLELEITETTVLGADKPAPRRRRALRRQGVGVAFDDYGTGYASLSLLKSYPLSRLKIDRQFVTDLCRDAADVSIVRAVLALSDSMGLGVIAEGVETSEQAQLLTRMGCAEAQGFLYGRPMASGAFRQCALSQVHSSASACSVICSEADPISSDSTVRADQLRFAASRATSRINANKLLAQAAELDMHAARSPPAP